MMWLNILTVFEYFMGLVMGYILLYYFVSMLCFIFHKCRDIYHIFINDSTKMHIMVIESVTECSKACSLLTADCRKLNFLGFDCEWICMNGVQRPVALLQLASASGLCCLFRLNKLNGVPCSLQLLLNNNSIFKIGVSPLNDAKLLYKNYRVQVSTTLDLRHLYPYYTGLASLAEGVIGLQLDKNWQLRCSNWEDFELSEAQKIYAAKDAFVAIEIFKKWLSQHNYNIKTTPKFQLTDELMKYSDIAFNPTVSSKERKKIIPEKYDLKVGKTAYATRKSPLYDNCFMNAPDGRLLCSCDKKKAQWYVDKGLAEVLPGEPYTIKLLFEPAARGDENMNGDFYRQLKQNCCVVCGALDSYLKYYVVPKEYRKHFPAVMKDHQSHDIVLLCINCHCLANRHKDNLRKQLAVFCNADIHKTKIIENKSLKKIRNDLKILSATDKYIPEKRIFELANEIKQYFQVESITEELVHIILTLKSATVNENNDSHGIKVVNYYKTLGGGLKNLELLWRQHFLDTMKPKYLPTFWSPTHNH